LETARRNHEFGLDRPSSARTKNCSPRREVDLAHTGAEYFADRAKNGVACGMTVGVVHLLEVVEVEQDQPERVADPVGAAPFERELLVEGAAVREPGEGIGRGLRGDATEVAQHAQERAGEHERDEDEQREGPEGGVADALPVRRNVSVDRLLWAQCQQAGAARVLDRRRQRPVAGALQPNGASVARERDVRAQKAAVLDEHESVSARVRRVSCQAPTQPLVERLSGDDLAYPAPVHRQPDRALEDVRARRRPQPAVVQNERDVALFPCDAGERGRPQVMKARCPASARGRRRG
jgi:hypothetical protein